MAKLSVVVLAGTENHSDLARVLNALELVKEAKESGDEVELVFDGAGVSWVPELSSPDHDLHKIYQAVSDRVAGACAFCASAFDVKDDVKEQGVPLLSEYEGHPSLRKRIADGYSVVTF